ncbi:MAG TPA: DUF1552 domain-containing protein [Polyangiaceae bacterium]|jgi:hypothetical protein|nr:DUF1552 domain-containing protein [Polyangiaceae bacterium]
MNTRRSLLRAIAAASLGAPFSSLLRNVARASQLSGTARRLIVYYFPDGIPEPPDNEPSQWHMSGSGRNFTLSTTLQPLAPFRDSCVFFNKLTMGPIGEGAHPQGAQKLLTGTPDPQQNQQIQGPSIDQYLATTIGQTSPFPYVYLGAQATVDSVSSNAFLSYPDATRTAMPMDNPFTAWSKLFSNAPAPTGSAPNPDDVSIFNAVTADLNDLQAKLGSAEKQKVQAHLDSLRQLEKRVTGMGSGAGMTAVTCKNPTSTIGSLTNDPNWLAAPENFPAILKAQMDLMVQAMACGLTRVGVVQASQHTTNLIMSRFSNTPMYAPPGSGDMRSHQASHYGNQGSGTLFTDYVQQVTWWVQQFAYLLGSLKSLPEASGSGTMLDNTLVLMCSEISNGSTHSHGNMPFVLAGGGGGAVDSARLGTIYDVGIRNHADLLTSLAIAMGDPATASGQRGFGQGSTVGGLPGLLKT